MQTTSTTELIRDRSLSVIASDLPPDMTLAEYRAARPAPRSRWARMRVSLAGAPAVGVAAQSALAWRVLP
jgi:hypothetical protein